MRSLLLYRFAMVVTNFALLFWDTINQITMSLIKNLLELVASSTHPAISDLASSLAAVSMNFFLPIWVINWILYHIVLEFVWSSQNPPDFPDDLAWYIGFLYDPPSLLPGSGHCEWIWFLPFSGWHRTVVTFTMFALPNGIAELAEDNFDDVED